MRYLKVLVTRSAMDVVTTQVVPWEVPVLEALHGGQVQIVEGGDVYRENEEFPDDAGAEYDRLAAKYGSNNETGQSYVALAYGPDREAFAKKLDAERSEFEGGRDERLAKREERRTALSKQRQRKGPRSKVRLPGTDKELVGKTKRNTPAPVKGAQGGYDPAGDKNASDKTGGDAARAKGNDKATSGNAGAGAPGSNAPGSQPAAPTDALTQ